MIDVSRTSATIRPNMLADSKDLFDWARRYPDRPGAQRTDTSVAAAEEIDEKAGSLRSAVMAALNGRDLTADECAGMVGETVLSIRPRLTELRLKGMIEDSGQRRPNISGRKAIVWRKRA